MGRARKGLSSVSIRVSRPHLHSQQVAIARNLAVHRSSNGRLCFSTSHTTTSSLHPIIEERLQFKEPEHRHVDYEADQDNAANPESDCPVRGEANTPAVSAVSGLSRRLIN